jgi:hypothetical protein
MNCAMIAPARCVDSIHRFDIPQIERASLEPGGRARDRLDAAAQAEQRHVRERHNGSGDRATQQDHDDSAGRDDGHRGRDDGQPQR